MTTKYLGGTLFLALTLGLGACGGGGGGGEPGQPGSGPSGIASTYRGIWLAEAYGRAMEIGSATVRWLDYTSDFCLAADEADGVTTEDLEGLYRLDGDQLEQYGANGTAALSAPGERFSRVEALPDSCRAGLTPTVGESGYSPDAARDLALYAQLLSEYSIHPELRNVDISAIYSGISPTIGANSSEEALVEALFQLTAPLGDIHTSVETPVGLVRVQNKQTLDWLLLDEYLQQESLSGTLTPAQVDAANAYIGAQRDRDRAVTLSYAASERPPRQGGRGQLTWFTNSGIGYLAIDAMTGFAVEEDNSAQLAALDAALDEALGDLQDVAALVVDVRRNGGGRDFLALAAASRFAANETLAYRKQARLGTGRTEAVDVYLSPRGRQYLGPVLLLTSASTVSGGEVFALAMRSLPQVTLLGEPTQGAFSDVLEKRLTNGYAVGLANEYYLDPEGRSFETLGVPVDVEVIQFDAQHRREGIDLSIEAAVELLGARGE
ncbi:S41 family peptidase [Pseudohaliea sp.]|uniref:S41 family peptidase n=1 Tax=Pseudohaliea sp. TaxID=2740289 RepID=UPI0032EE43F1